MSVMALRPVRPLWVEFTGTEDVAYDRATTPLSGSPANIGASAFTWEGWMWTDTSMTNTGSAFSQAHIWADRDLLDGGSVGGEYIWSFLNQRLHLSVSPGTASGVYEEYEGTIDVVDGAAHWIVIQYDPTDGRLRAWVDGTLDIDVTTSATGTLAWQSGTAGADDILELGGEKHEQSAGANLTFVGRMSEIRLSNIERYSASSIGIPSAPLAADDDTIVLWSFTEGSGTTVADSVGGADLTLQTNAGNPPPAWLTTGPYDG